MCVCLWDTLTTPSSPQAPQVYDGFEWDPLNNEWILEIDDDDEGWLNLWICETYATFTVEDCPETPVPPAPCTQVSKPYTLRTTP